jgi:ABC-type glycerol-3-phosphate transport system substrate-binding protein
LKSTSSWNADLGIFEIEPTLMVDWAEAGYFLPLDDVVAEIGAEDFVPGSLFSYQGHVYALPYATSVYGLWVRKDLFEKAGLPLPSTYQQALSAAKTLTQGETYGIALPAGQNIATVNYFSTFLWQNGGDYFNCAGELTFEEPQALEAVRRWKALAKYAPPGFTTWGFTEQIEAFLRGRVAMSMYAGRLGLELVERNPELEDKVSVVFPPWGPEKVTLGVWSRFAIAKGTRHPEEAKAFLTWLLQGDRLLRYDMVLPGHMIPPLKTVQEMAESYASPFIEKHPDWYAAFNDWVRFTNHPAMNMGAMEGGHFVGSNAVPPWGREVFGTPGIVDDMLQAITLGKQPEEEAWQEAVQEMGAVLTEWKAQHPDWKPSACR